MRHVKRCEIASFKLNAVHVFCVQAVCLSCLRLLLLMGSGWMSTPPMRCHVWEGWVSGCLLHVQATGTNKWAYMCPNCLLCMNAHCIKGKAELGWSLACMRSCAARSCRLLVGFPAGRRNRPVPHKLVVDVREFMSGLPAVLHTQGFKLTPITLEVHTA